jgi:hypothetical protein
VLIAPYGPRVSRNSPPNGFVPFKDGRLDLAARVDIPIGKRFQYYAHRHVVRQENTFAWIEGPSKGDRKGPPYSSSLVTFAIDITKRTEVQFRGTDNEALLAFDGSTVMTTQGRFLDAKTGEDLLWTKDAGGFAPDEKRWWEELTAVVTDSPGLGMYGYRVITVRNRVLYYVSVVKDGRGQPTQIKIMAGALKRPLTEPVCLKTFPYYDCRPLYNDKNRRPDYLHRQQCVVGSDGITVWDGEAWAKVPWFEHNAISDALREEDSVNDSPEAGPPLPGFVPRIDVGEALDIAAKYLKDKQIDWKQDRFIDSVVLKHRDNSNDNHPKTMGYYWEIHYEIRLSGKKPHPKQKWIDDLEISMDGHVYECP